MKNYNDLSITLDLNRSLYNKEDLRYEFIKRSLDIILSLIGIMIGIPIVIIFGGLIKLEDNGPVFYTQERLGRDGRKFLIYKLRSMRIDAEKNGAKWADKNDSRITKIGGFIRKTRIDEIPQLINILRGEMSIVGPRPERPIFTYEFNKEIPGFANRLIVKPGLTGWAQVNGGYDMSPKEKFEADMYYIKNKSVRLDLMVMVKTVRVVLTGEGAR